MPRSITSGMVIILLRKQSVTASQDLSASEGSVNHSLKMSFDLVSSLELRVLTPPNTYIQPDGVTVAE